MKGIELAEVCEAIVGSFTADEFDMFLRARLNFRRRHEVADGPFNKIVNDVVERFESEGRDAYLIAEVAAERPLKGAVQAVYRKYAASLIGETWRTKVEAAHLATLDRYGLLPEVQLQRGGRSSRDHLLSQDGASEGFQRLINRELPELDAFAWAAGLLKALRRVCRVEVGGQPRGTGFLVGADLVLTNHHVIRDLVDRRSDGRALQCRFDYQVELDGSASRGVLVGALPAWAEWHVDSSPCLTSADEHRGTPPPTADELDHALIRLERRLGADPIVPGGPTRGWIPLPASEPALKENMPLAILQHPGARPIKLAFDTKAVLSVNGNRTRVRYATNTEPGASGSPCFDLAWSLVALHHFGDAVNSPATFNQGVPVAAIYQRMQRIGRTALFTGDPS